MVEPTRIPFETTTQLRVRYAEIDRLGTFYNARVLEWFECGRSDFLRQAGVPYTEFEVRGIFMPVIEAKVQFVGRAYYDDELEVLTSLKRESRMRLKFHVHIYNQTHDHAVAEGYTIHTMVDEQGQPCRPPRWLEELTERVCQKDD